MTIDEAIKYIQYDIYNFDDEDKKKIAEWLEELKTIKEIDLSIPQHFTKEQSEWIKAYCIQRNKEFYDKGIDDSVHIVKDYFCQMLDDGADVFSNEDKNILTYNKYICQRLEKLKGDKNE